jgi:hypothetical protein
VLRTSPFGAIVGAALLAVAVLPLLAASDTTAPREPSAAEVRALDRQLAHAEAQNDALAAALADANRRLAAAGQVPVVPTTAASQPRRVPQDTAAGSRPLIPQPLVPSGLGTAGTTVPGTTTDPTRPTPTTTTASPAPPTTAGNGCPAGYTRVIKIGTPVGGALVCRRLHLP